MGANIQSWICQPNQIPKAPTTPPHNQNRKIHTSSEGKTERKQQQKEKKKKHVHHHQETKSKRKHQQRSL